MSSETVLRWQRSQNPQTIYPHVTRKSSPESNNLSFLSVSPPFAEPDEKTRERRALLDCGMSDFLVDTACLPSRKDHFTFFPILFDASAIVNASTTSVQKATTK